MHLIIGEVRCNIAQTIRYIQRRLQSFRAHGSLSSLIMTSGDLYCSPFYCRQRKGQKYSNSWCWREDSKTHIAEYLYQRLSNTRSRTCGAHGRVVGSPWTVPVARTAGSRDLHEQFLWHARQRGGFSKNNSCGTHGRVVGSPWRVPVARTAAWRVLQEQFLWHARQGGGFSMNSPCSCTICNACKIYDWLIFADSKHLVSVSFGNSVKTPSSAAACCSLTK
jgi:hypothetical protein